ncbi:hypothetical protein AMK59_1293, partial [Oryctes borbonicus]
FNPRPIQSDETTLSLTSENITSTVRRDMKENFEVLSNKMVDFHETSWQTYDRLERTLRSMSLVSNLTRYEIQNGLRSLTVEVGRLSGGQGLLSDSSKEKSKLHEIDKKIDSNFESLMLAQNLFMENCYRLQKDEPQLETKISEVLDEMINTFNAKTSVTPKDIKKLEQAIKNHDSGMKNALKSLGTVLHKSHLTDLKIEDGLSSLNTIKINLTNLHSSNSNHDEANRLYQKIEEAIQLLKNLQKAVDKIKPAAENDITNLVDTNKLQHIVDKLENLTKINSQATTINSIKDYMEKMGKIIEDIENKTNVIEFIFTEQYKNHWQMFLDEYAQKYLNKVNQTDATETGRHVFSFESETIAEIKRKCFSGNTPKDTQVSIFDCLQGILSEDERRAMKLYCLFNTTLTDEECVRNLTNIQVTETTTVMLEETMLEIIKTNCFPEVDIRNSAKFSNFECLQGHFNEDQIQNIRLYCIFHDASSEEACLRNITGMDNKYETVDTFNQNTIDRIKTKCFPSLTFESGSGFECLQGILLEDEIQKVKNYCVSNDLQSEEVCLRNITKMINQRNFIKELDSNTIQIIRTNCFSAIDLRYSANLTKFECLNSILNESSIQEIKNYCLLKEIRSEEDCLRNITSNLDDIDEGTVQAIKINCSPEIDVRNLDNFSISDCIKTILNETEIAKIKNYCCLNLTMNEEDCLRKLIDLEGFDFENVLAKITEEVRQTIRTNCFPEIDLRFSDNASIFKCLNGILSEDDIRSIKAYCSSNALLENTCLNKIINVDNSKANITKRNEDSSNGSDNIKRNSNENLLRLQTQADFVNVTAITPETTRETDYQTTEIIEHNEYEDYSLGIY